MNRMMLKRAVYIAPLLAMLLMWPGIYQAIHRVQHHLPAPQVEECCHHHGAVEAESEAQGLVVDEFEHCFVCDFEFALYQDVQLLDPLGYINLPEERIAAFSITFHHKYNTLQLRPRGPPSPI
jgi:hypothetical protein